MEEQEEAAAAAAAALGRPVEDAMANIRSNSPGLMEGVFATVTKKCFFREEKTIRVRGNNDSAHLCHVSHTAAVGSMAAHLGIIAVATAAMASAAASVAVARRTPFGLVHFDCILQVSDGAIVGEEAAGVYIKHTNGSVQHLPPCAASPRAPTYEEYAARRHGKTVAAPPGGIAIWEGWPFHYWWGSKFASTTNPKLQGEILSLNGTWKVPARPVNTRGNSSDPWGQNAPTLSVWTGIQGGAVLQPVAEFNGLQRGEWDYVSWNCCPSGYVTHSDVLTGMQEGDTLVGTMSRPANSMVFNIVSTWIPASGGPTQSVSLKADMAGVANWKPQWAEVIHEAYSVTSCQQVPCAVGTFTSECPPLATPLPPPPPPVVKLGLLLAVLAILPQI